MIRAYFFDLDDTLFDTQEQIKKPAYEQIIKELGVVNKDLRNLHVLGSEKEALARKIIEEQVNHISLLPGMEELLTSITEKKFLITKGQKALQEKKIQALGIKDSFDEIIVTNNKEKIFKELVKKHHLAPQEVLVIGDKEYDELAVARKLGLKTFNVRPRIVSLGGGTGQPVVLEGVKEYSRDITAIVTMADDGGSSGRLREELGVLPPGDVRNCLIALSESEELLHNLFRYRFTQGGLEGHNFGNLFLSALEGVTSSFESAVLEASKILNIKGKVIPISLEPMTLCATLNDDSVLVGEKNVFNKPKNRIKQLSLQNPVKSTQGVLDAIKRADIIVLGPGSLYTSTITNLLVEDVQKALLQSQAKIIYVTNLFTEPKETEEFMGEDFVYEITKYLEKKPDLVIMNNKTPPEEALLRYKKEEKEFVEPIAEHLCTDLLKEHSLVWEKKEWLHHDAKKLGTTILWYWREQIKK